MPGSMRDIPSNGATVPAYVAVPDSGRGPGVVVVQEWWGLVPHVRDVADRLAAEGFVALAPDLYHGKATREPDEAGKLLMDMDTERAGRDLAGAVDALGSLDETSGGGVGAIGFCMGGGLALYTATLKPEVRAAVSYYGFKRPGVSWEPSRMRAAVLGHFAEHDDYANRENAERWERELRDAGLDVTFHHYPGTSHAFFNDDRPEVYVAEAAEVSWRRTLEFLRQHLG